MLQFDSLRQQLVIAMPLHKVGAAHERTVFRCAAIVVPEIEVGEVDGMRKWRSGERAVVVKAIDDRLGGKNLCVGTFDDLLAMVINAVNEDLSMALRANLLHVDLGLQVVRAMGGNCIGKVPAEPVRWIVRNLEAIDTAHVTRCAGGHEHIPCRKRAWVGIKLQQVALSREHDTVLRFVVNLNLGVVWPHVALTARTGQSRKLN